MKIAAIEAIPYSIPYRHPLHFASGSVHEADHVLVRVHTDDGVVGTADTPPRPYTYGETQKSIVAVVQDVFAPQLVGIDVFDREKIQAVMARTIHNQTAKGAVDIAVWDVIGKTLGQPVTKLLGGYTDSLRVSHMLGFKPARELLALALEFLEEPDDAREVLGRRRLVTNSPIPIAADESAANLGEAAREILTGGANLLSVKTARSGFTEAAKIVGMAEGMGIDVYIGNQIDTQVGTVASVAFGAAFAHTAKRAAELSNYLDMSDDLLAEPLAITDGRIRVPEEPGVGTAIDEDKLDHYRTDR